MATYLSILLPITNYFWNKTARLTFLCTDTFTTTIRVFSTRAHNNLLKHLTIPSKSDEALPQPYSVQPVTFRSTFSRSLGLPLQRHTT